MFLENYAQINFAMSPSKNLILFECAEFLGKINHQPSSAPAPAGIFSSSTPNKKNNNGKNREMTSGKFLIGNSCGDETEKVTSGADQRE
jgi:hypothetical protein